MRIFDRTENLDFRALDRVELAETELEEFHEVARQTHNRHRPQSKSLLNPLGYKFHSPVERRRVELF